MNKVEFRKLSPSKQLKTLRGTHCERVFTVDKRSADEESRTVWLSIASEEPYERWFGMEVLDLSPQSIRDTRLRQGAPLLVGHDTDDQVGVVEDFQIAPDKKLRILARFSKSARAEEIFQDVLDGIRRNTSVGYIIHDLVLEKQDDNGDTYRVTDWEPLEGSLVPIPADPTVGIGRSKKLGDLKMNTDTQTRSEKIASDNEAQRVHDLVCAGDEFVDQGGPALALELVRQPGATVGKFNDQMLSKIQGSQKPFHTAEPARSPSDYQPSRILVGNKNALRAFGDDRQQARAEAYSAGMWLRGQLLGDEKSARWCQDRGLQIRAASGGIGTAGGFLVPDILSNAVIFLIEEYGIARKSLRTVPMTSDSLSVPRRTGGLTSYYVGENSEITESENSWDLVGLSPKKLAVLSRFSSEISEDAVIDLASWLSMETAQAFAGAEDNAWLNGDGTSTYGGMIGARTKIIDGNHAAGAVDATSGNNTFAEITTGDLDNLVAALPAYAQRNAKFYVSQTAYALIFQRLIEAAGGLTLADMVDGPIKKGYMGYPIEITQKMPSGASTDYINKAMILFGDMNKAGMLGSRRGIRAKVDESRYLEFDQTAIMVTERFDINIHDLGDGTTAGPVVALIGN